MLTHPIVNQIPAISQIEAREKIDSVKRYFRLKNLLQMRKLQILIFYISGTIVQIQIKLIYPMMDMLSREYYSKQIQNFIWRKKNESRGSW